MSTVRVDILGPLRVTVDSRPVPIGGGRLRSLLARLAVDAGRPVSIDALTAALWPVDGPADPAHALQSLATRLRRALPESTALRYAHGGYLLDIEPEAVDLHRFERLAREGRTALRSGEPATAARSLREALELWRGEPTESDAALAVRCRELRLNATEDLAEAELLTAGAAAAGHLVAELRELAAAHPDRERPHHLLMRALRLDGQLAEALAVYGDYRTRLADRLGADPGPDMRAEHLSLLRGEGAAPAARGNLRTPLTSFIGRETELQQLADLFDRRRLVTLTGPGGVGKTRLASDFAAGIGGAVWLVELAAVTDPAEVARSVMDALGLREDDAGPKARTDRLVEAITDTESFIVLDNCEHLIDESARLAEELLGRCPRLRLLATSREPLNIPGETLQPVGPLPVTAPGETAIAPAVRLFADRATAADPHFALTATALATVTDICRRLDGLPLAIELAAARLRAMPIEQLEARLDDRFRLLTGGPRTALPRHQALEAVVAWSWDLLTDTERAAAERLAVFTGSFTATAAEHLGASLETVESLADKSLVQPLGGRRPRFRMLETVREYGRERLAAAGELDQVRADHAAYFLALAEATELSLRGPEQLRAIELLDAESDNCSAAFHYATASGDAETAQRLCSALSLHWAIRRGFAGSAVRLRVALEAGPSPRPVRISAVVNYLFHTTMSGAASSAVSVVGELDARPADDPAEALAAALYGLAADEPASGLAALEPWLDHPDAWTRAMLHMVRSFLHTDVGDSEATRRDLATSLGAFKEAGDRWGLSMSLMFLGFMRSTSGEFDAAVGALEESVRVARDLGVHVRHQVWLAMVRTFIGDVDTARAELAEVIDQAASPCDVCAARIQLADLDRYDGDLSEAKRQLELAADADRACGDASHQAMLRAGQGFLATASGDLDEAAGILADALDMAVAMPDIQMAATVGVGIAALAAARDRSEDAAAILGAAHALRGAAGEAHPDIAATTATLRAALGERAFQAAYGRGRDLDRDGALARLRSGPA